MRYCVLIADDDRDFLEMLRRYLSAAGFSVYTFPNVKSALSSLSKISPDIVLTDVEMPGLSGFDFIKILRENPKFSSVPAIMMSGKRISEIDMIEGYHKGSDDYLVKPFSMQVLSAKIKNILKRAYPDREKDGNSISFGEFKLLLDSRKVLSGKKEVNLTKKEFDLILILAKEKGKIVSSEKILDSVWGYENASASDPHTIEQHISSIRKKLGLKKEIKKVSGHGYILEI
ncbi:MAG: response regulator transcription factor [Elusimicrobiota bacterium]